MDGTAGVLSLSMIQKGEISLARSAELCKNQIDQNKNHQTQMQKVFFEYFIVSSKENNTLKSYSK